MLSRTSLPRSLIQILLTVIFAFLILLGETFTGILRADIRLFTVVLLSAAALVWGLWRWRARWAWHVTPLDAALIIGVIALLMSGIANADVWRRSAIGWWHIGLYIGIVVILYDLIANGAIGRKTLLEVLALVGVIVVLFGWTQVSNALRSGLPLPRPVSLLGNPNLLAAFLIILIPNVIALALTSSGVRRLLMLIYALAAIVLLALTGSRAAYLGFAAAMLILALPILPRIWKRRRGLLIVGFVGLIGLAIAFLTTFTVAGRTFELRTFIYDTALQLFAEEPLFGQGFFTFGSGLSRLNSIPPTEPHSHAHNLILHTAAELGIIGLIALAVLAFMVARAGWMRWRYANEAQSRQRRAAILGSAAAVFAFAVHQLFDVPAMLPAVVLTVILPLIALTAPDVPLPARAWRTGIVSAGWIALSVAGIASGIVYREYTNALAYAVSSEDYAGGADRLASVLSADPNMPIYHAQRGMLLAWAGDINGAVAAFERFTALEPDYAFGWANLAVVYQQENDLNAAYWAAAQAHRLAPEDSSLIFLHARAAEAANDVDTARRLYNDILTRTANYTVLPDWDESPLRASLPLHAPFSDWAALILAARAGDLETARSHYLGVTVWGETYAAYAEFLLASDDDQRAAALSRLTSTASTPNTRAYAALAAGDADAARRALTTVSLLDSDWELGTNIQYIQFLTTGFPRIFLPDVGYDRDPVLLMLLDDAANNRS